MSQAPYTGAAPDPNDIDSYSIPPWLNVDRRLTRLEEGHKHFATIQHVQTLENRIMAEIATLRGDSKETRETVEQLTTSVNLLINATTVQQERAHASEIDARDKRIEALEGAAKAQAAAAEKNTPFAWFKDKALVLIAGLMLLIQFADKVVEFIRGVK